MAKKLVDMSNAELIEVIWQLTSVVTRKISRELHPNLAANKRHQYHKHVWGKKKLALIGLLHQAVVHCPADLAADIQYVLDHEENHYKQRDHKTERKRLKMVEATERKHA